MPHTGPKRCPGYVLKESGRLDRECRVCLRQTPDPGCNVVNPAICVGDRKQPPLFQVKSQDEAANNFKSNV